MTAAGVPGADGPGPRCLSRPVPVARPAGVVAPFTMAEVAEPAATVTGAPTWVPSPVSQPTSAVTSSGAHRKKVTVPVGTGRPPTELSVATSFCVAPGSTLEPPGVASVVRGAGVQVLNWPPA